MNHVPFDFAENVVSHVSLAFVERYADQSGTSRHASTLAIDPFTCFVTFSREVFNIEETFDASGLEKKLCEKNLIDKRKLCIACA
ncbi:hypothetical protein L596_025633 [Steinernema carpocapsae]|uniref:Uncharacterized protein n=1 Tax=Steinernema carpocapsae TaxID=34508 RepID=A0A4U5M959_STECR|nr:hypothetical protein L596_025633 [Steinernema carpocapsae]